MAEQLYEDNTKKASTRVLKEVQKINPKASAKTTFQQAFELLMKEWDMEISIESDATKTVCNIYRDNDVVHTFNWTRNESFVEKERDWDWNFIYRNVLEHIAKTRLFKRPKISKRELNAIKKAEAEAAKAAEKAAKIKAKEDAKAEKEAAKLAKKKPRKTKA